MTLRHSGYKNIRSALEYAAHELYDHEVEEIVEDRFPGVAPELVEDFFRDLQRFGQQIAPLAQRALPAVIQGAAAGSALGPVGAVVGALGGGAASILSSPPQPGPQPMRQALPPQRPAGVTPPFAPPQPSVQPPRQATGAVAPPPETPQASSAAASQLIALLSQPQTMQALTALLMGSTGRTSVPVGQRSVPVAAIANAISELAAEAADNAALASSRPSFLLDPLGEPRVDIGSPLAKAQLLVADMLVECHAQATRGLHGEVDEDEDEDEDEDSWSSDEDESDDYGETSDYPSEFYEYENATDYSVLDAYEAALAGEVLR
jgi:hypothetical protein